MLKIFMVTTPASYMKSQEKDGVTAGKRIEPIDPTALPLPAIRQTADSGSSRSIFYNITIISKP
jgi:hypothetical protein